jgi:aspartyl-tRNA(Asn)/glutamyl-tRNA(Gln) amidotransferase subunit A
MQDILHKSLTDLAAALKNRDLTCTQAVQACLDRIQDTEPRLGALISSQPEAALARAAELDSQGPDPDKPLWGVPLVVKDVLATAGVPTTCGSRILEDFTPCYDATAVAGLKQAGAVIIAKANMDEFAMGSSNENSAFHPTVNPWDTAKVPGGSSGGSAVAVSARQCFGSLGTDTGGSIRLPASFCGVVGIKPTYGRVSRHGLVAYGSSLDQAGAFGRNVPDASALLQAVAGFDPRDSTSVEAPVPDYAAALKRTPDLSGMRIGLPREYWGDGVTGEVLAACTKAVDTARELGAEVVDVSLPLTEYAIAAYYIIVMAEASSNLARFDGVRYGLRDRTADSLLDLYKGSRTKGFGDEVKRRIIIGTYVLSSGYYDAYYRKAAQVRRLIRDDFNKALESCDVIIGPTCPTTAFPLGDKTGDPLQMYLMDIFTISLNLAGLPGLSLPVGLGDETGMPVGLQIFGPAFGEPAILAAASGLELALGEMPPPGI